MHKASTISFGEVGAPEQDDDVSTTIARAIRKILFIISFPLLKNIFLKNMIALAVLFKKALVQRTNAFCFTE